MSWSEYRLDMVLQEIYVTEWSGEPDLPERMSAFIFHSLR
jgi:hypothetical protein